jgi:hypothetical protein
MTFHNKKRVEVVLIKLLSYYTKSHKVFLLYEKLSFIEKEFVILSLRRNLLYFFAVLTVSPFASSG